MIDQANDLRDLVMHAARPSGDEALRPVKTVLVAGGKGGVGTTTVAVNLAVAASQQGVRTVLVDADPDAPDVQILCRLRQRHTISDVLRGRRTLGEALQPGPGGVMILPGAWATADLADASELRQTKLIEQFSGLGNRADLVVLDGGNGLHPWTRRLWHTCHELVLVSSPDNNVVLDTYAAMKVALDPARPPRVHLLVNSSSGEAEAAEVHARIRRSCLRFLGFDLPHWHWLPGDADVVAGGQQGVPFALTHRHGQAAQNLAALTCSFGDAESEDVDENAWDWEGPTANNDLLAIGLNLCEEDADKDDNRSLSSQC